MMVTISQTLQLRAEEHPDDLAYCFLSRRSTLQETLTYRELFMVVRAMADRICAKTAWQEPVGCVIGPGLQFVVAFLACLWAGRIAVPIGPPRFNQSLSGMFGVLRNAGAVTCICDDAVMSRVAVEAGDLSAAMKMKWIGADTSAEPAPLSGRDGLRPRGSDIAYLQYTSGSTGRPRGVVVRHDNLSANSEAIRQAFGHSRDSVGVIWLPPFHDMGLVGGILQPLHVGFPVYLMSPQDFLRRPLTWLEAVSQFRATTSGGPNFAYEQCVTRISPSDVDGLDLSHWSVAFTGAEPVSANTMDAFARRFAPAGFRKTSLTPCYGLAEATLIVTCADRTAAPHTASPATDVRGPGYVSCGPPVPGTKVAIVDEITGRPCAEGGSGEIWVHGPGLAAGYWKQAEASENAFGARLAPAGPEPYLRTGDIGFLMNDELYVCGRLKSVAIIRGVNRHLEDVEQIATTSHPALFGRRCAAFVVPTAVGDEGLVLLQEAPREARAGAVADTVLAAVRSRISAEFGVQPTDIRLVASSEIPKTASGKIQRGRAREMYLASISPQTVSSHLD
jgi:acyl-CoA synthetase (AMP-forming)/AMP-acid ligase II